MILRKVSLAALQKEPYLKWNAFVDLIAVEEYEDLSDIQRTAHLAFQYDSEVLNGGHLQYFENAGLDLIDQTLTALEAIGARSHANVLRQAVVQFNSKRRVQISTAEEFAHISQSGEFDSFDQAYHKCRPEMNELLSRFLDSHTSDFVEFTK